MAGTEKRYKIGDVCKQADVQPYVLRYWETEFPPLAPDKTGGGQRTYTQRDIEVILRIKELLYTEGFTIAGAKKKLELEMKDGQAPAAPKIAAPSYPVAETAPATAPPAHDPRRDAMLQEVRGDLRAILEMLED